MLTDRKKYKVPGQRLLSARQPKTEAHKQHIKESVSAYWARERAAVAAMEAAEGQNLDLSSRGLFAENSEWSGQTSLQNK